MNRIVFLLEEYSMKVLLEGLLPRILPGVPFLCIHHNGKQDLEQSVPRKLRAWREPGVRFVVVRDNDGADCRDLKSRLVELCATNGRPDTLVRIACQELESWYFGDTGALADAYENPALSSLAAKARYRVPDDVVQPSRELGRLIDAFQKVSGARAMSTRLTESNTSRSFQVFLEGCRRISQDMESIGEH